MDRRLRPTARLVVRGAMALVLMALLAGIGLYVSLDAIVRRTAARDTTWALALSTTVGAAHISPFRGRIAFTDFRIASPNGYVSALMLDVPASSMDVTYRQLRADPVHIPSMTLDRPVLVIESRNGTLNLTRMTQGMPKPAKPLMLVIDKVTLTDPTVILKAGTFGVSQDTTIPLATFQLQNLGHTDADHDGQFDGARMRTILNQLLAELATRAADSDQLPMTLRLLLKGDLAGMAQHQLITALPTDVGRVLGSVFSSTTAPSTQPATHEATRPSFLDSLLGGGRTLPKQ